MQVVYAALHPARENRVMGTWLLGSGSNSLTNFPTFLMRPPCPDQKASRSMTTGVPGSPLSRRKLHEFVEQLQRSFDHLSHPTQTNPDRPSIFSNIPSIQPALRSFSEERACPSKLQRRMGTSAPPHRLPISSSHCLPSRNIVLSES